MMIEKKVDQDITNTSKTFLDYFSPVENEKTGTKLVD